MVRLELVWFRGLELGFPALILRMAMEVFAFTRRLMLSGAVSEPVETLSAILAGSGFATDAMLIILIKPCDTIARELPAGDVRLFVDDLTVHVVGTQEAVRRNLTRAVNRCVDLLEGGLGLRISRGVTNGKVDTGAKTLVLTSSGKLAKALKHKMNALGIHVKAKGKMLGIDFSCGRRVARVAQATRVRKVASRRERYLMLGKKAATRLVRTGAAPAMNYGASVYGTPSTTLKAVRGFACAVRGEVRGRSSFARLLLAGYDPGVGMAVSPILDWAKAIWDDLVHHEELQTVWKGAHVNIAGSQTPFRRVAGPGGAMLASCLRIGWKCPSFSHLARANGEVLDLRVVCPMQVLKHATADLSRLEAGNSSLAKRIGGAPDLEPLCNYLTSCRIKGAPVAGSLRALGEGGWWGQARLYDEGRVDDPWRKACGDRGRLGPALGTLHHRMCGCAATKGLRDNHKDQEIIGRAQSSLHGEEPLFQHGIPVLGNVAPVPTHEVRCCGGRPPPADFTASGNAFTDGAMRGRAPIAARRAGWAWVIVDERGDVIYGLHGPCPDPFPTAFRAELRAVCELLFVVTPPITIWVDNKEVLDGISKGKQWCCSSARQAADLWRTFWHKMGDIDDDSVVFVKTKGHATDADVQSGRSSPFQKKGNEHADHFAGRGVDIALGMSPNDRSLAAYKEAIRWYRWLAQLCNNWPNDVDPKSQLRAGAIDGGLVPVAPLAAEPVGSTGADGGCVAGAAIAVAAGSADALDNIVQSKKLHSSHSMRLTGDMLWCSNCGCYGQTRFKALKKVCRGNATASARVGQLARLRLGRHPATGEPIGQVVTSASRGHRLSKESGSGNMASAIDVETLVRALQRATGRMLGHALGKLI